MKILLFDIETMANKAYVWGKYEQDVISFIQPWYMMSFAYKWLGDKQVKAYSLPDFKLYKRKPTDDRELCKKLWKLFDEADVVVAHNGNSFDIKKTQARFIEHGFKPPNPFKSIDTKLVAKLYFKFESNKLDDLGKYLHIGQKLETGGWQLWLDCEHGKKSAWEKMVRYNKQDVALLEKVYLALRPWIQHHPNSNLYNNTNGNCPNCGQHNLRKEGVRVTTSSKYQRFQCKDCGAYSYGAKIKLDLPIIK